LFHDDAWWKVASDRVQERAVLLTSFVFAALANAGRVDLPERVTRSDLERRFARLRDPEAMAALLDDPDERARAVLEHRELLDCPWSPLPLLDDLFADEGWEELDLTPAHVVECYAARMEELRVAVEGKRGRKGAGRKRKG